MKFSWIVYLDQGPTAALPGFQIKEAQQPHCPVAVVTVPDGQTPKDKGYKRQKKNAKLVACAPEMHKTLKKTLKLMESGRVNFAMFTLEEALNSISERKV